ncbi:microtubule-associated tumor suppressor 1 homolog A-like isoform X2 [Lethenteron reissneri]|uniref:microtubule-associated tumor suppressor 1 homolog A-like isoform X2 n=1 Tax=Lethenteron reissneri TaxID=7753 RepID=UPI002AB704D8|nr:microtubule-associated tumor suppressor 1 homolog A-like isoform X2 [Lethenteron reissneri]
MRGVSLVTADAPSWASGVRVEVCWWWWGGESAGQAAMGCVESKSYSRTHSKQPKKNEKSSGKLTDLNLDLKSVQQQLAIYVERCTRLEQEKEAAERDAVAALAVAERRHAEALSNLEATLRQQFDGELEQLQQTHEQELDARVAQQKKEVMSEIEMETVTAMKEDLERSINELNQSFESERTSMQNKFEREKSCLEETVKTLTVQIKTQKEEISSIGKLLKNTSASKEGSPQSPASSPHMEDELNSLKAVVDIRTQQIHTLERRILTLQQEADAKRIVEEKLQVLQQQNEDMKARMDKSMEVTRQLSSEQTALQASLQREAKAKQRLSMEKEQLMWKLQNGSSPGVSPSSPPSTSPTFFSFQSNNTAQFFSTPR